MGEGKIYDASATIDIAEKRLPLKAPYISILTDVEYPPAVKYARVVLYPAREDYLGLAFRSQLTPSFWVALLSGALCLTGWILSKREARVTSREANP